MKSVQYFIALSMLLFSFNLPNEEPVSVQFNTNPSGKEHIKVLNASYEKELIHLVNQYRIDKGLSPLKIHPSLMLASRYHAADMAIENYFEHATHNRINNSLKRGISTFKRINKFYDGYANTENCGAGYQTPHAVFQGWVKSPGHHANLLNKRSTHIGVGYYKTNHSKYGTYWVFASAAE